MIDDLLHKEDPLTHADIVCLLNARGADEQALLHRALEVKLTHVDNLVRLRGLIEYSNVCRKNCYYCGLRADNHHASRYTMTDDEVIDCARQAMELHYGSIAIQCGERNDASFTATITRLVRRIKEMSHGSLGITLSCGEQSRETYREWRQAGAHRYLLRIESANRDLFYRIHPHDDTHSFETRDHCIDTLLELGYQVGTGSMIGLPFQTVDDMATDLLYFRNKNVAMVGMGPFIPHPDTPLWRYRNDIPSGEERLRMTLRMLAILRLMMPDINMVSATANQTLHPLGRSMAVQAGANVLMPNLSPNPYRKEYLIYPDKPCMEESADFCSTHLELQMRAIKHRILYDDWGDSKAFLNSHGATQSAT